MLRVSRLRFAWRVRGFPFNDDVRHFFEAQDEIFVVEQNRVGRMRVLLVNEPDSEPKKLKRGLHYDGSPITARIISETIAARIPMTTAAV
jgi:2-oxoglutarate ferredoxin oxidoreductase subunit alpha